MLFTWQKNLMGLHLWGHSLSHSHRELKWNSVGCQTKSLLAWDWLALPTPASTLHGNWVLAISLLFEKEYRCSKSPALYKIICSIRVQILGKSFVWTPKLCFSKIWKHLFELKLRFSSCLTIIVNFDNSKAISYIDLFSFVMKTYCLLQNGSRCIVCLFFDTSLR